VLPAAAISAIAGVPDAASRTTPDRRGARDRVVRRSAGPSVALMTRAYVSLISSHAAPYRFMPEHHVSRGLPDWMPSRMCPRKQFGPPGFAGFLGVRLPGWPWGCCRCGCAQARAGRRSGHRRRPCRPTPGSRRLVRRDSSQALRETARTPAPRCIRCSASPIGRCSAASSWRPPRCGASQGPRQLTGLMPIVARSRADSWDVGWRVSRRLRCGDMEGSPT
jgi:hypothetical protein